ncbi:MAG: ribonuclease P protein component 1 [Candidatus Nanoarchaeia archaeon]|nr:ribonuclease P protein component 1 [Candidatus Nanoarchaeia archaeon]
MAITPANLVRHELIGLIAEISESRNKSLIGEKGKIIDETRNMLIIETKKGEKKSQKEITTYIITLPSRKRVEVEGTLLVGRSEERLRKKISVKKRW